MSIRISFLWLLFISYVLFMCFGREITPYVTTGMKNCLPYGLQNTNNGTNSYCICSFNACPGDLITVTACGCSGSVILSLVNQTSLNLDRLYPLANQLSTCQNSCPGFSFYIEDVKCRTFAIREGCLNAGSCSATLTVTTSTSSSSSNSTTRRLITTDSISASSGSESDTCSGLGATYIVVSIIVLLLIPLCIIGACIFCFIGCCCPEKARCTRSPSSVVPMAAVEHVQGTPTFIVHTLPQQQAQQQQPQQNKIYYGGVDQASVVVYERLDVELGNTSKQSVPTVEAQQVFY